MEVNNMTEKNTLTDGARRLVEAAIALQRQAGDLRDTERAARRRFSQDVVQPWTERLEAAQKALADFVHQNLRALEDQKRLLQTGHADLVDRKIIDELRALYEAADSVRSAPPEPPAGLSVDGALRQLRRGGLRYDAVEAVVEQVLGPQPGVAFSRIDDTLSRWSLFLAELPDGIRLDSGRGYLWMDARYTGRTLAQQQAEPAIA